MNAISDSFPSSSHIRVKKLSDFYIFIYTYIALHSAQNCFTIVPFFLVKIIDRTDTINWSMSEKQIHRSVRKRNVEDLILVWLDEVIDKESKNYQSYVESIEKIISTVHIFNNLQLCTDFIEQIDTEKIFLLLSVDIIVEVVSCLHMFSQIDSIYILCKEETHNIERVAKYSKIKGVFTRIETVYDRLKYDTQKTKSILTPINIVTSVTDTADLNSLNPSFMYSQLLKECLIDVAYDNGDAMNDLSNFCTLQYAGKANDLKVIEEFHCGYKKQSPIWW